MPSFLKYAIPLAVCFTAAVCAADPASAGRHRIRFLAPGADTTTLIAMNSAGAAIGNWAKKSPVYNGAYLRAPDGTFTDIRYPGASATRVFDINASGAIVGEHGVDSWHGFIRDPEGSFVTFDLPGDQAKNFAQVYINAKGMVGGSYYDAVSVPHGFFRDTNGSVVGFDSPAAPNATVAGIDNRGNVAGTYYEGTIAHGFLRAVDGTFSTIDVQGAGATIISAMSAHGDVVGNYGEPGQSALSHAFFRDADGTVTVFDGNKRGTLPVPTGVDDNHNVTGDYLTKNTYWGFKYAVGGKISTFNFCHEACRTWPNAVKGGVVGGNFELWHGHYEMKQQAFLRF